MLTGESRLVAVGEGSAVTGGTLAYEAPLTLRATSTGPASALAGIGRWAARGGPLLLLRVRPATRAGAQPGNMSGAQPIRAELGACCLGLGAHPPTPTRRSLPRLAQAGGGRAGA